MFILNLSLLFNLQSDLDKKISSTHNLEGRNIFRNKILALHVEVCELANESRCFKFWSLKESSAKEVLLEEYVDCLHFILSLGLSLDYTNITIEDMELKETSLDLSEIFIKLIDEISSFSKETTYINYVKLFSIFMVLGSVLTFSFDDIEKFYLSKNNINHLRQEQGY